MNLIVGHNNDENVLVLIDAEVKCEKSLLFIINPVVSILIGTNLYSSFKFQTDVIGPNNDLYIKIGCLPKHSSGKTKRSKRLA